MFDVDGDGKPDRTVLYNGFRAGRDIVGPVILRCAGHHYADEPAVGRAASGRGEYGGVLRAGPRSDDLIWRAHYAGVPGKIVGYADLMEILAKGQDHHRAGRFRVYPHRICAGAAGYEQAARSKGAVRHHVSVRWPRSAIATMDHRQWGLVALLKRTTMRGGGDAGAAVRG